MQIALILPKKAGDGMITNLRSQVDKNTYHLFPTLADFVRQSTQRFDRLVAMAPKGMAREFADTIRDQFQVRGITDTVECILLTNVEADADYFEQVCGSPVAVPALVTSAVTINTMITLVTEPIAKIQRGFYPKRVQAEIHTISSGTSVGTLPPSLPSLSLAQAGVDHSDTGFLEEEDVYEQPVTVANTPTTLPEFDPGEILTPEGIARKNLSARVIVVTNTESVSPEVRNVQAVTQAVFFAGDLAERVLYLEVSDLCQLRGVLENPSATLQGFSTFYEEDGISFAGTDGVLTQTDMQIINSNPYQEFDRIIIEIDPKFLGVFDFSAFGPDLQLLIESHSGKEGFRALLGILTNHTLLTNPTVLQYSSQTWFQFVEVTDEQSHQQMFGYLRDHVVWDRVNWFARG